MSITMGDALAATRSRLDEVTATAWTDPEIRGWINEAVAEIARRTESFQYTTQNGVSAGTATSLLPANVLSVSRLEWWTDNAGTVTIPLEIREIGQLDSVWFGGQQTTQGTPAYASLVGFPPALEARIYPIPAADGYLSIYYYAIPLAEATDGSGDATVLQMPSGWEDLIYDYATQVAQRRDANPQWQDTRSIFEAKLQQMWDKVQSYSNQEGFITPDYLDPWGGMY